MRLTKFNPETGQYEYIEKAKTLAEFRAQRKAVIQRLGEYEDRADGEWIWTVNGEADFEQYWECSVCGGYVFYKTKYCSDCGAKMKGETDEQR